MVFAFANNKGGCGKTTSAVNIGAVFAQAGHPTLLVDMDPQGAASLHLGIEIYKLQRTIADVLLGNVPLNDVLWQSDFHNLHVAPSNLLLDDLEMTNAPGREFLLDATLAPVKKEYAHILIDCPPRLGILTNNALIACDTVILPIQVAYFALEGTSQILNAIRLVHDRLRRPDLEILRVIPTLYDSRTSLGKEILASIQEHFGDKVTSPIPMNVKLDEASAKGTPAIFYAPTSTGAQAYEQIGKEILNASAQAKTLARG
jgi:chromosome partitioning protein